MPASTPPCTPQECAEVRHHIEYKTRVHELDPEVADRMLSALTHGASPDYAALLEQATFLPPPALCFHTAPVSARTSITRDGLLPAAATNWGANAAGQPVGVYVAASPDTRGVWSHWDNWDVWAVDMSGLDWAHDRLNPGCWVLPGVPAHQVTLHSSHNY